MNYSKAEILVMDMPDLLDVMVQFQRIRANQNKLTPELLAVGIPLFSQLVECAKTAELRILCQSYLRHLKAETGQWKNNVFYLKRKVA